ncbi:MAG: rod shape-determining protein RodA [Actinomycetota bacterium]
MSDHSAFGSRSYLSRDVLGPNRLSSKSPIRHVDPFLVISVMLLTSLGCIAVSSASKQLLLAQGEDADRFLKRQLIFFSLATIVFGVTILFDYRRIAPYAGFLYLGVLVLLVVVMTPLGQRVAGAQRWIGLGAFQIQPAELMKVAYIGFLAMILSRDNTEAGLTRGFKPVVQALGLASVPAALTFLQPDLGTVLVLLAIAFAILMVAGVQVRWLLVVLGAGILISGLAIRFGALHDYQVARLTSFLDNEADLSRTGYNLAQSKIAIGSGGFSGKGLGNGSQTNLAYVPEQRTDFIFTAIGEERGFVGALVVITLFAIILWRCIRTAMLSKDLFGALVAGGVAAMFGFQLFVNVGMTIGIMPITGIPLPFVSYGGSSLITSFIGVGLVMNIHMRRFV